MKSLTDKCSEISQLKDWLEKKKSDLISHFNAYQGEKVSCPREIFQAVIICN